MPRPAKGARLYLRARAGREPQWVIRDGDAERGTGCGARYLASAEIQLADYITGRWRPDTGKRDLDRIGIADVLALYGAEIAPQRASAALIGYHMAALLAFWGGKTLAEVKGSTCRAYAEHRQGLGRKPATAKRELKTLGAAINHWHRESALPAVPRVTLPIVVSKRERVLERAEAAALLSAARRLRARHVARFILIGLYTGTRHNAILQLRWQRGLYGGHVDLERGILYRRGASEQETSKRRPPLRLSARLVGHCRRWASNDHGDGHVISYQGRPILKMKRAWASVVTAAGLGRDVTPHVLRHTCASWALWRGETIWDVAGLIGADASTVDRVYGHHRLISGAFQGQELSGRPGKLVGARGFEPRTPTPPEKRAGKKSNKIRAV